MRNILQEVLGYPFSVEELENMKITLAELGEYFDIVIDVEKMIKSLNVTYSDRLLYIALTIVSIILVNNNP